MSDDAAGVRRSRVCVRWSLAKEGRQADVRALRRLMSRVDRCNVAQRVALTIGVVSGIVLIAAALAPPAIPTGGWFGYAPNTSITFPSRPLLFGQIGGYRPWVSTLWWLATDVVATAVAIRLLRGPRSSDDDPH